MKVASLVMLAATLPSRWNSSFPFFNQKIHLFTFPLPSLCATRTSLPETALKLTQVSIVNSFAPKFQAALSGACTTEVPPLKVKPCSTFPAANPAPFSTLPLMPFFTSVASPSPGNHATRSLGVATQTASFTVRVKLCVASLPTPFVALKVIG